VNPDELAALARSITARAAGGEGLEVALSHSRSTTVKVYQGQVESFTSAENRAIGIRVVRHGRQGFAHAGSLDDDVVGRVLSDARDNLGFAEPDEHLALATPDGVPPVDQDLWHDETLGLTPEAKIELALDLERAVTGADPRITGVRVASFADSASVTALASTEGIEVAQRATSASLSVQALARDGERTQTGFGWDAARHPGRLDQDRVVRRAVSQAVDLIGASKPATRRVDLVLDPYAAATVLGLVAWTLTGDRVIKGRSPFVDRVGEQVASPLLGMVDDPTDPASLGADTHDGEGLACRPNPLVVDGVLHGFLHDSYTGRRSGTGSTGSAVRGARSLPGPGVRALAVRPGSGHLDQLIAGVDQGLLVFSLAGLHSGVNPVSGDFSVGVEGRLIRGGELAEPVSECTLGSTLQRLLLDIRHVGGDLVHLPSGVSTPSVVVADVVLSGAAG
jgi:PmbA protein